MRTITVDEAQSELPQVLDEVEAGAEVIISRGEKPVARLVRITDSPGRRPKVGQLRGAPFQIPDAALAPLTSDELKEWEIGHPLPEDLVENLFQMQQALADMQAGDRGRPAVQVTAELRQRLGIAARGRYQP